MKRFALVPVACAAALLFSACSGSATQSAPPDAASAPTQAPAETASTDSPSRCAPAEMATTLEYQDGGAGHRYYVLRVENTGRCRASFRRSSRSLPSAPTGICLPSRRRRPARPGRMWCWGRASGSPWRWTLLIPARCARGKRCRTLILRWGTRAPACIPFPTGSR